MTRLLLFSREGCHLCADMADALLRLRGPLGFDLEIRDVDQDPALDAAYGQLVPVLVTEAGLEICHYHLDTPALERALAACP